MTVEVHTFGCRLNSYESELIKKAAGEAGLKNTIIFNGCAVTSEAERQLRQAIRKARRTMPDKRIIVTGCAAQINPSEYAAMNEVDQVIGNTEKTLTKTYALPQLRSERILVNDIMSIQETASHMLVESFDGKARAFLQVQNGCNHRCTYCAIPYGRGNNRSVPLGEIVKQAQLLVEKGYKELVLTGVDITDYGLDLPGTPSLGQIVKRLLAQIPQLPRLRLSSIDVAEVDNHLLDLLANEPRFMPHLHLSLQAGDNLILKRMKRRHNREQVIQFCNKARELRPDVALGADIIAGFPTETEEMFGRSCDIVTEAGLVYLHIFPYSERAGTPAARMPQVAVPVRKKRAANLRELGRKMLAQHYRAQVGRTLQVIVEDNLNGRAEDFSLVRLLDIEKNKHEPGSIMTVKIVDETADAAVGQICDTKFRK